MAPKNKKPKLEIPGVSVTLPINDFDIPAIIMDTDGRMYVDIPEEVLPVVRSMLRSRVEGRCSITVTIAGYAK